MNGQSHGAGRGVSVTGAGIRLRGFEPGGAVQWTFFQSPTNLLTAPDVGPDGVIYIVRNTNQLYAINPDGTLRWVHVAGSNYGPGIATQSPYSGPAVAPDDAAVLVGGTTETGRPGVIDAFSPGGDPLWSIALPLENGGRVVPASRPIFAPDAATAYIGTSIPGQNEADEYCYLYAIAIDEPGPVAGDVDGNGVVDVDDLVAVVLAWGPCPGCPADLDGSGSVDVDDLVLVILGWTT